MYKADVPGQRADGQKQVIVVMKEDFLQAIDGNLEAMGFGDRSQFIRTAVLEKLARNGVPVVLGNAAPPSRVGKGGRPKKVVEMPVSKVAEDGSRAPEGERKKVTYPPLKRGRKGGEDSVK